MQERNLCSQRTGELFPRKCFLKDILLNRNFQKPQAFCELAIASVNFPVNVHYTYRRQRGFTSCCTAAMPSSSNLFFSILSSSRCCEVLQTPEFVHSLPPSVYVHAPSTERWNIDNNGMNHRIQDCHQGGLPGSKRLWLYNTTFNIIIIIMIIK